MQAGINHLHLNLISQFQRKGPTTFPGSPRGPWAPAKPGGPWEKHISHYRLVGAVQLPTYVLYEIRQLTGSPTRPVSPVSPASPFGPWNEKW